MLVNDAGGMLPLRVASALGGMIELPIDGGVQLVLPVLAAGHWRLWKFADIQAGMLFLSGSGDAQPMGEVVVSPDRRASIDMRGR